MLITINQVLPQEEIANIRKYIENNESSFASGLKTAGWHAKQVKKNEQLESETAAVVTKKVAEGLTANAVFAAAARPKALGRLMVSRYGPGMEYGSHVDDALMGGMRTDLSFTLFLSEPDSYEGGALVIEGNDGDSEIKLDAGGVVLYPSTSLHRVSPVTSGERLAVVGWVRSFIRGHDEREVLFDIDNAIAMERQGSANAAMISRLLKVRMNLTRLWADD